MMNTIANNTNVVINENTPTGTITMPKMMTVRQIAATGLLPECAIRSLLKQGKLPAVYSGKKAFINFDTMCEMLANLQPAVG